MTKKFIIVIILSTLGLKLSAQKVNKPDSLSAFIGYFKMNKVVLEVYKIDSALVNGIDQTDRYRKASAAIIFYTQSNYPDTLMTVIMPGENSESWGEIEQKNERPISRLSASKINIEFVWKFTNTIDGLSGNARVRVEKVVKDHETSENFEIQADNGVTCRFISIKLLRNL